MSIEFCFLNYICKGFPFYIAEYKVLSLTQNVIQILAKVKWHKKSKNLL